MPRKYGAIVIGVSAGGVEALSKLFPLFPAKYPFPKIAYIFDSYYFYKHNHY